MKKLTNAEFIERCKLAHGDTYDYSETIYNGDKKPVTVKCRKHGEFSQRSDHHLCGSGCKLCAAEIMSEQRRSNAGEFIRKARAVHGSLYDYSLVNYITARTKVTIVCPTHGQFYTTPDSHLAGHKCKTCANKINADTLRNRLSDMITKAALIHDNKYNYDKIKEYVGYHHKVTITCIKHGDFSQNFNNHISGSKGCPSCNTLSKSEKHIAQILKKYSIDYKTQQSFDDFRNPATGRKYRFDFYIPSLNILIEYDGQHHYKDMPAWRTHCLEKVQRVDELKNKYCEANNIQLLRISYKENIIDKLQCAGVIT